MEYNNVLRKIIDWYLKIIILLLLMLQLDIN
jgi:hypothetical protein